MLLLIRFVLHKIVRSVIYIPSLLQLPEPLTPLPGVRGHEFLVQNETAAHSGSNVAMQMVVARKCKLCQKPISKNLSGYKVNLDACSAIIRSTGRASDPVDPSVRPQRHSCAACMQLTCSCML